MNSQAPDSTTDIMLQDIVDKLSIWTSVQKISAVIDVEKAKCVIAIIS